LQSAAQIESHWKESPRWKVSRAVTRPPTSCLRGTVQSNTPCAAGRREALALPAWLPFVNALGALTGNQAMQQVRADSAIYLSGWRVAGTNLAGEMCRTSPLPGGFGAGSRTRINNTLLRADQICHAEGNDKTTGQPIVPTPKPVSAAC
jgi:isocitrate lyase